MLCSANRCRSPMAAALLDAHLRAAAVDATVTSAGMMTDGEPAWPDAANVLATRGFDLSAHESTRATAALVHDADLVLGMAREHVRDALALDTDAYSRSFTLKELVRRGEAVPRQDEPLEEWLASLSSSRSSGDLLGASSDDDVADPIGRSRRAVRKTADLLDDLTARLVRVAWPASTAATHRGGSG